MPKKHQAYAEWTPDRIISWAEKTGHATAALATRIIKSRQHPQQGFRACLGILRFEKSYGKERLEAACQRALDIGAYSYKSVESILKNSLDKKPFTKTETTTTCPCLRKAKLKHQACVEDIDYATPRGVDKSLLLTLTQCQWVKAHQNIFIVGPTGIGKTFLACALAHKACLMGYTSRYYRLTRLLADLQLSKDDGRYVQLMKELAKVDVLLLDDFGLTPFADEHRRDLLEILDDRHDKQSTLITSQLPVKLWHETIGNGTLADAILDRLVHNAQRIEMKGESMRKKKSALTKEGKSS